MKYNQIDGVKYLLFKNRALSNRSDEQFMSLREVETWLETKSPGVEYEFMIIPFKRFVPDPAAPPDDTTAYTDEELAVKAAAANKVRLAAKALKKVKNRDNPVILGGPK